MGLRRSNNEQANVYAVLKGLNYLFNWRKL